MADFVIMPKQGLQMTSGYITKWMYSEGQRVKKGSPLFQMETDKLTIDIDSPFSGVLLKIVHGEGEEVPITEIIAIIGEEGESYELPKGETKRKELPETEPRRELSVQPLKPLVLELEKGRLFATPRARTVAKELGVDISRLKGSAPLGMVVERDVLKTAKSRTESVSYIKCSADMTLLETICAKNGLKAGSVIEKIFNSLTAKMGIAGELKYYDNPAIDEVISGKSDGITAAVTKKGAVTVSFSIEEEAVIFAGLLVKCIEYPAFILIYGV